MAKRLTDTEKWKDPWFCGLNCEEKLFWVYLLDTCNMAGIWQVNWPLVKFYIPSFQYKPEIFQERIQVISDQKWHVKKFTNFQYGELQPTNRMHQRISFELVKEGVSTPLTYPLQGVKDKRKDKDKEPLSLGEEKGVEGEEGPTPEDLMAMWNAEVYQGLPRAEVLTDTRKRAANARLREHPDVGFWKGVLAKVNASSLLRGEKGSWKCTFDWILSPSNLAKVIEGNYDDKRKA